MFLRRHVSNADLKPQALADHMRISVRTVHKRFEEANTTFRQWLLDERLNACRRALADPRCNDMTVAQIAYSLGFNDLSHFSKTFRARFACRRDGFGSGFNSRGSLSGAASTRGRRYASPPATTLLPSRREISRAVRASAPATFPRGETSNSLTPPSAPITPAIRDL